MSRGSLRLIALLALALAQVLTPAHARAQADLFSAKTLSGVLDLRLAAADGERAWIDRGFGKARFGGGSAALSLGEAALAWTPRLSSAVGAVVTLEAQEGLRRTADIGEAYVTYRSGQGPVQVTARAGLYYPTVSLEHDGYLWTVPDTITPSAINSWVAEEVKVGGAEVTLRGSLGGRSMAATAGAFGYGDTAGTLLSFRGWALHDLKSAAHSVLPLPPLSPYMRYRQAPHTTSVVEIDHRFGGYGRLEWKPTDRLTLDLFAYDNRSDLVGVRDLEWAWETRFANLGARLELDDRTRLKAQALVGETLMGYRDEGRLWVDAGFASAYVLATRDIGPGAATGRVDYFTVSDRSLKAVDNNAEAGWAATAAYRWDVSPRANIVFEALHVDSDRPARALARVAARQRQTVLQTALRLAF